MCQRPHVHALRTSRLKQREPVKPKAARARIQVKLGQRAGVLCAAVRVSSAEQNVPSVVKSDIPEAAPRRARRRASHARGAHRSRTGRRRRSPPEEEARGVREQGVVPLTATWQPCCPAPRHACRPRPTSAGTYHQDPRILAQNQVCGAAGERQSAGAGRQHGGGISFCAASKAARSHALWVGLGAILPTLRAARGWRRRQEVPIFLSDDV